MPCPPGLQCFAAGQGCTQTVCGFEGQVVHVKLRIAQLCRQQEIIWYRCHHWRVVSVIPDPTQTVPPKLHHTAVGILKISHAAQRAPLLPYCFVLLCCVCSGFIVGFATGILAVTASGIGINWNPADVAGSFASGANWAWYGNNYDW